MLKIFIFICFTIGTFSHPDEISCPKPSHSQNIDIRRIQGLWRDVMGSPVVYDGDSGYPEMNWDGTDTNKIEITFYLRSKQNGKYTASVNADAQLYGDNLVTVTHVPALGQFPKNVTLLKTDYKNYLALWGCESDGTKNTIYGWMKVRELSYSFDAYKLYQDILKEQGLDYLPMKYYHAKNSSKVRCSDH